MFLKAVWFITMLIFLMACSRQTAEQTVAEQALPSTVTPSPMPATAVPFTAVFTQSAETYRRLRPTPSHFSGGAWNDALDGWNGEKHQAMQTIATELDRRSSPISVSQLTAQLDTPDETLTPDEPRFSTLAEMHPTQASLIDQILLYHWRGQNDYLYFLSDGEEITAVSWWYAGE